MQETPVGSVLDGLVLGVCMMEILLLRKKSAEPPRPFKILEPMTHVELAWAYISLDTPASAKLVSEIADTFPTHTSTGVFIPITPSRRIISGLFETCCDRRSSLPA